MKWLHLVRICYGTIHILRKHLYGVGGKKMPIFAFFSAKNILTREGGGFKNLKYVPAYVIYESSLSVFIVSDTKQDTFAAESKKAVLNSL